MDQKKIEKILNHLNTLIDQLDRNQHDREIQNKVSMHYYLQKESELCLLHEQMANAHNRLEFAKTTFNSIYSQMFTQFQKDARWLNQHLTMKSQSAMNKGPENKPPLFEKTILL